MSVPYLHDNDCSCSLVMIIMFSMFIDKLNNLLHLTDLIGWFNVFNATLLLCMCYLYVYSNKCACWFRIHVVETYMNKTKYVKISRSYIWHGKYKWGKFIWQH